MDALVRVAPKNYTKYLDIFKHGWPRNVIGWCLIKAQMKWIKWKLECPMEIYAPFGNMENGFVAINELHNSRQLILQTPNEDTSRISEALVKTKLIDWNKNYNIPFADPYLADMLKNTEKDLPVKLKLLYVALGYLIKRENIRMEKPLPPGFELKQLSLEHAQFVNDVWDYKFPGSEKLIETYIRAGLGFGLFKHDQLLCFALKCEAGYSRHNYAIEKYRGKGYNKLFMSSFLKTNDFTDDVCWLTVVLGNNISINSVAKLNPVYIDRLSFFETLKQ